MLYSCLVDSGSFSATLQIDVTVWAFAGEPLALKNSNENGKYKTFSFFKISRVVIAVLFSVLVKDENCRYIDK